jgi:acyl carrier protein
MYEKALDRPRNVRLKFPVSRQLACSVLRSHIIQELISTMLLEDEILKGIVERHLPLRDDNKVLTSDSRLRDFGVDSLLSVVLSLEIQEFYKIDFPLGALNLVMFATLGELQEKVRELVQEAAGA